jgi:hypothetical protein
MPRSLSRSAGEERPDRAGNLVGPVFLQEVRGSLDQHGLERTRDELGEAVCDRDRQR